MKKILVGVLLLLAGCTPQIRVYTDTDPDYDLWTYKTFDWSEKINIEANKNPLHYNELNDKRIKSAVTKELQNKGYQLTANNPDLLLHYHIVVDDQAVITTEPHGYFYSPYWVRMRTNVYSYREGTLIIDMMDAKTKNLMWRGWAVAPIEGEYKPKRTEELINLAVSKIFRKFPAKAKSQPIMIDPTISN
jgi:hypothetical protein